MQQVLKKCYGQPYLFRSQRNVIVPPNTSRIVIHRTANKIPMFFCCQHDIMANFYCAANRKDTIAILLGRTSTFSNWHLQWVKFSRYRWQEFFFQIQKLKDLKKTLLAPTLIQEPITFAGIFLNRREALFKTWPFFLNY